MTERLHSDKLIEQLAGSLEPVRPALSAGKAALGWALIGLGAAAGIIRFGPGMRPDLAQVLMSPQLLMTVVILAVLAGVAAKLALALARPGQEPSRALKAAPWMLLAMLVAVFASYGLDGDSDVVTGVAASGFKCSGLLAVAAVLPGVVLFVMTRRLAALRPGSAGAAIGLAAAAAGGLGLALHCPSDNVWHLLIYHALPVGVIVACVAAAGARWLRW